MLKLLSSAVNNSSQGIFLIILIVLAIIIIKKIPKNKDNNRSAKETVNTTQHKINKQDAISKEREWFEKNRTANKQETPVYTEKEEDDDKSEIDFTNSYEARYLLTKNEWQQYNTLKKVADTKGYIICPKVRLLDIIQPRKDAPKYKTLFYKIQAKHVDFVICGSDLKIKAVIELDDNSHDTKERKERDEFVDLILRSVGYKVIHTRYITIDILDTL